MPNYKNILAQHEANPSNWHILNIGLIWMTWYTMTFVMLVIMLNFTIAVITSTYERVSSDQKIISFKHRADLSLEIFELLSLFGILSEFKILLFSNNKDEAMMFSDDMQVVV